MWRGRRVTCPVACCRLVLRDDVWRLQVAWRGLVLIRAAAEIGRAWVEAAVDPMVAYAYDVGMAIVVDGG